MDFVLHNFLTKKEERRDEIGGKWRKRRTHEKGRKYIAWGHSCIQKEEKKRRKWKKIFGEGKYIFGREEEESRGNRRQIIGEQKYISEEKKSREGGKRRKIFGEEKSRNGDTLGPVELIV